MSRIHLHWYEIKLKPGIYLQLGSKFDIWYVGFSGGWLFYVLRWSEPLEIYWITNVEGDINLRREELWGNSLCVCIFDRLISIQRLQLCVHCLWLALVQLLRVFVISCAYAPLICLFDVWLCARLSVTLLWSVACFSFLCSCSQTSNDFILSITIKSCLTFCLCLCLLPFCLLPLAYCLLPIAYCPPLCLNCLVPPHQ